MLPGLVAPPERPLIRARDLCSLTEVRVYEALAWGSEKARRVNVLAAEAGLSTRALQDVLDHLVFDHHVPVGTSMKDPYGNYLIESTEDLEKTVQLYTRRGLHSLAKAGGLRRESLRRFLAHVQRNLDLFQEGDR